MASLGARCRPARLVGCGVLVVAALLLCSCQGGHDTDRNERSATSARPDTTDQQIRTVAGGPIIRQRIPATVRRTVLRDQDGRPVTLASLHGKTVVLAPQLTLCQETCPMTSALMHQAAQDAERAGLSDRVVFAELTVDPWRDTVTRLHAYRKLYGALPDWTLLTGEPRQVTKVWEAIGVSTVRSYGDDRVRDWMTGKVLKRPYDVHHQDIVFIIDPDGRIRWIRLGRPDARSGPLPATMKRFLNDEGRQNYRAPGTDAWTAADVEKAVRVVRALPASR